MFKNLLVPLDGTPQSNVALPFARVLAHTCRSRLVLVRVLDPAVLSPHERLEQPAIVLEQLKRIADELHSSGIEVDARVSTGEVVSEVLHVMEVEHTDALVVATHAPPVERLLDNSTTDRLIAHCGLPVFVVRRGGRRVRGVRTLLAPVDGSPGAAQALGEAVGLARRTGAAVVLVRVIPPPEYFGFDPLLATTLGAHPHGDQQAQVLAAAEEYVNELARRLRAHGIDITPKVMVGLPAERIVAAAEQLDADVIVMSTHAYPAPVRSLLGSTAAEVVRAARRPVLLVRRTVGLAPSAEHASPADARRSAVSLDARRGHRLWPT